MLMTSLSSRSTRRTARLPVAVSALAAALATTACSRLPDFPDPPGARGVEAVVPDSSTAAANGKSVVTVTVTLDPRIAPKDAKVTLTTTVGTFLGTTTASSITVSANDDGVARAQLRAPAEAGVAIVGATLGSVTRYANIAFTAVATAASNKGVTAIDANPSVAPADGASIVGVRVTVDVATRPSPTVVTLRTTAGTFLGDSAPLVVPVNDSGYAYAQLRAPTEPAVALLSATAGGITRYQEVVFQAAAPSAVQLTASAFELRAGSAYAIDVTARLLRAIGVPSAGAAVTFSADTAGGRTGDFGLFSPATTTSVAPVVSSRFSAGATRYRGRVTVRVRATRGAVTVVDSTTVVVVP